MNISRRVCKSFVNNLEELVRIEGLLEKMLQAGFSKLAQRARIKMTTYENHFHGRIDKSDLPKKIYTA